MLIYFKKCNLVAVAIYCLFFCVADFKYYLHLEFIRHLISQIYVLGFFVPFIYLVDMINRKGLAERHQAAFILSIIGIVNTTGRVLCGWVSDKPWADPLKIYNAALIVGGVVTMAVSWMNNYILLCVYAAVFGLCIGRIYSC